MKSIKISTLVVLFFTFTTGSGPQQLIAQTAPQTAARPLVQPPQQPWPARRQARREPHISVVDFGANGRDQLPDSDAIQRAIDSLPRGGPDAMQPVGGVVVLPAGRYVLNKPLRIHNGITLRGEWSATVLHAEADHPAILVTSPYPHGYCVAAVVEDLSIFTRTSAGISVDPKCTNILQTRFENLIISAGQCAIDLNPGSAQKAWSQNMLIRNIQIVRYGGGALTLWGNQNHIEQIDVEGGTREGFRAHPAIINVSGGSNDIRSCLVGANQPDTTAVAFCVSGSFTWAHNWVEMNPDQKGPVYIFKDVEFGQIDYLHQILPWQGAKLENCESLQIRTLNLDGTLASLDQYIEMDEKSTLRVDQVIARMDAGMLDDPRVSIGSVYNKTGKYRLDFPLGGNPTRIILADAENRADGAGWRALWETPHGTIAGSMRLEKNTAEPAAPRVRIDISDNPNNRPLRIQVPLPANEELIGQKCVVTWRIDGPGQTLVLHNNKQIPSRAMHSLTACALPEQLKPGDILIFELPPEPGTYFISELAVYPAR